MIREDLQVSVMFFSATGNCKRIAGKIASCFGNDAALIDITHSLSKTETDRERHSEEGRGKDSLTCGLLFVVLPVYCQLCPAPIIKYLKKLPFKGAVVPCVSYGSVSAGIALRQIGKIFKKNGAAVVAGAEFPSLHFYFTACGGSAAADNNKALNERISHKENQAVTELCSKALMRYYNNTDLKKLPVRHFNPLTLITPKLRTQIGVRVKYSNKSQCTECGRCKSICPYGAVTKNFKASNKCFRCGCCVISCKNNNKQLVMSRAMKSYLKKYVDYTRGIEIY